MTLSVDDIVAAFGCLDAPKWIVQIPTASADPLMRYLRLHACRYVAVRIDRYEGLHGIRPAMLVVIVAGTGSWERSKVIVQAETERLLRLWLQHRRPEEVMVCGFGRGGRQQFSSPLWEAECISSS